MGEPVVDQNDDQMGSVESISAEIEKAAALWGTLSESSDLQQDR